MPRPSRRGRSSRATHGSTASRVTHRMESVAPEEAVESLDDSTYAAPASTSSRRSAASSRSSRRSRVPGSEGGAAKSRRSSRRTVAQELTPELLAERRRRRKAGLVLALGLLLAVGVIGGVMFLLRPDPLKQSLSDRLVQAGLKVEALQGLSLRGSLAEVPAMVQELREQLEPAAYRQFPDLAARAEELLAKIDPLEEKAAEMARRRSAEGHLRALQQRLKNIRDEADLDGLLLSLSEYQQNPSAPGEGVDSKAQDRYGDLIAQVRGSEKIVNDEIARRGDTTEIVNQARARVSELLAARQYRTAETELAALALKYPKADLGSIRQLLNEGSERGWEGARKTVQEAMAFARSAGASAGDKNNAQERARKVLTEVIEQYQDRYVEQARALKAQHNL